MWYESASKGNTYGGAGNSSLFLSACLLKSLVLTSQILGGASEKQPGRLRHKMSQEDRGSLLHLLLRKKAQSCQAAKAASQTEKEKRAEKEKGAEIECHWCFTVHLIINTALKYNLLFYLLNTVNFIHPVLEPAL